MTPDCNHLEPPEGIDKGLFLCYILYVKSYDERHAFSVRIPERGPFGARALIPCGKRYHFPSCAGGNAPPVTPVTASMSDGASRNQGGTVEYFVSHP